MTQTTERPGSRLRDAIAGLGRPEKISAPYGIPESALTEIGTVTHRFGSKVWFTARQRKGYEYSWDPSERMLTEADIPLDALYVEHEGPAGERLYRFYREWPAGAYAADKARFEAPPKRTTKPSSPVDALASSILIQSERIGTNVIHARPDIRGAQAIIDRLLLKTQTRLRLSEDRQTILVLSAGGRPYPNVVSLVMAATPLLLPYLATGKPPVCGVCGEAEAVTVAEVDVPWCGCAVQS